MRVLIKKSFMAALIFISMCANVFAAQSHSQIIHCLSNQTVSWGSGFFGEMLCLPPGGVMTVSDLPLPASDYLYVGFSVATEHNNPDKLIYSAVYSSGKCSFLRFGSSATTPPSERNSIVACPSGSGSCDTYIFPPVAACSFQIQNTSLTDSVIIVPYTKQ